MMTVVYRGRRYWRLRSTKGVGQPPTWTPLYGAEDERRSNGAATPGRGGRRKRRRRAEALRAARAQVTRFPMSAALDAILIDAYRAIVSLDRATGADLDRLAEVYGVSRFPAA